jgi:hypothetical protein
MDGYTRLILHGEDDNVADIEGASSYEEGGNINKDPEHGWNEDAPKHDHEDSEEDVPYTQESSMLASMVGEPRESCFIRR